MSFNANFIIDCPQEGVFKVHRSSMTSPEVLNLEWERIFEHSWLYLGHESEVPEPGDYRRRTLAGRPLFFNRGRDGQVRVFLNTCPHRGALICRRDEGNSQVFQCFYHAWSFNTQGELMGVPDEAGYGEGFDKKALGLRPPPRVEDYRGFYFVSFNPDISDLATYLAGATEYLDLIVDQSELGLKVICGSKISITSRPTGSCWWKTAWTVTMCSLPTRPIGTICPWRDCKYPKTARASAGLWATDTR